MNKKGFTLVELVVVVTVLMILGVIGMLSFQGYSRDSRDSVRIQDISSMKKVLELFMLNKGFYPKPTNVSNITHSGGIVWSQGVFGNTVLENLGKINKVPLDPLYNIEYTYSVIGLKTEYELGGILEGGGTVFNNNLLLNKAIADEGYKALVEGNYNGQFTRVSTGGVDYILALPGIITSDLSSLDVTTIVNNGSVVYNNENNLPKSYSEIGSDWVGSGGFDYNPGSNLVVFSGELSSLGTSTGKIQFIEGLQKAYSGTTLASKNSFQKILSFDTKNEQSTVNNFAAEVFDSIPQFPKNLTGYKTSGINGKCGDSDGKGFLQKPDNNLCSKGNPTTLSGSGPWSWSCNGLNNGNNVDCSANKGSDGVCGSNDKINLYTKPDNNLCSKGNPTTLSGSGPWSWTCESSGSGTQANCSANKKVDGVCGTSHNKDILEDSSITSLCSGGNASGISGSGPWNWTCEGENTGTSTGCIANFMLPSSTNAKLWLKADSFSSTLNNNDPVSTWTGIIDHVIGKYGTGGHLPKYKDSVSGILGGKPAVYFDGDIGNGYFINDSLSNISIVSHSIFIVFHSFGYDKDQSILGFHDSTGGNEEIYFLGEQDSSTYPGRIYHFDSNSANFSEENNYDKDILFTVLPGVDLKGYINGTYFNKSDSLSIEHAKFSIGQEYDGSGLGNYFSGYIAEVIMYDKVVSDLERQEIEDYLYNKYNFSY